MKIIKKIGLIILTVVTCSLGGLIAPLLGVNIIVGAAISLAGCMIYFLIISVINLAIKVLKDLKDGEPDA
jgi:hypothetical protein